MLDSHERLRSTLAHEMCHAAQWVLDGAAKPAHGAAFRKWAREAERALPGMRISTCHNYEIFYKYRYGCEGCGAEFGRQSKSVDLQRQRCGRCRGTLKLLGAFNRDGAPAKAREPSAFAGFVKARYGPLKRARPRATHRELMAALGEQWRSGGADACADDEGEAQCDSEELGGRVGSLQLSD